MDALDIISLNTAKSWLNIESAYTSEDITITSLIKAAIDWVEKYTCWRTYQRTETAYTKQTLFPVEQWFPPVGSGEWTGNNFFRRTPQGVAVYAYPVSITSVKDKDGNDVTFSQLIEPLRLLIFAPDNSIITLQTGFAIGDIANIPQGLITAALKLITYMYENRDVYQAALPMDIQIILNQYRRSII